MGTGGRDGTKRVSIDAPAGDIRNRFRRARQEVMVAGPDGRIEGRDEHEREPGGDGAVRLEKKRMEGGKKDKRRKYGE